MDRNVLVVGPEGAGGIDQYITEQLERMDDHVDPDVYIGYSAPSSEGVQKIIAAIFSTIHGLMQFPFQSRPDLVHVHTSHRFSFYRSAVFVLFSHYIWDAEVILHIHGSSFDDFIETESTAVSSVQALVFNAVSKVIVLSEYWEEVVGQYVDDERIYVVQNAVDPDAYDPRYDSDPVRLVFLSTLLERKGVHELVAATKRVHESVDVPFELHIAGDGPYRPDVEQLEAEYENVMYHGYVSESCKQELLSDGSVFILPTHAENLPIAMLEGMAGGNSIVSTTVGAIPEVIGDENGILFEPGDVDGLAAALEKLITSPDRLSHMGRTNRRKVQERYSWDRVRDRLVSVYED